MLGKNDIAAFSVWLRRCKMEEKAQMSLKGSDRLGVMRQIGKKKLL